MIWVELGLAIGGIVITVLLGWGPFMHYLRTPKPVDDTTVLTQLAKTIVKNYKDLPVLLYAYAEVKGAIRLNCVANNEARERDLVTELGRAPGPGEQPKPSIVIGEYGQGKTIACGALAYELASSFLKSPDSGRLPILVSLREHPDLNSVDQVALASVRHLHNFDLNQEVYNRARSSGRLVFVFDGLDELVSRTNTGTARDHLEHLRHDAAFRDNRLIVTSRPNVLDKVDVATLKESFDWITIQLPTLTQVYRYLKQRGLLALGAMINSTDAELLRDLIRRPLFLDMITASATSLSDIKSAKDITESRIYDRYFDEWYRRELPKMGPAIKGLTKEQVDRILSSAAYKMTLKNSHAIDEDEFVAVVKEEAQSDPRHDLDTLEKQATNRLLLVPEFSKGCRRFTFRHDSLCSYFSARHLTREFVSDPGRFAEAAKFDSVSLLFFFAGLKENQAAHTILSGLYKTDRQNRSYRRDLIGVLILYSAIDSKDVEMGYLRDFCASAQSEVRALLLANLSNKDFSGLDISNLNLSNAVLRNSNFSGTVLKNVDLRNGVLDGAKFPASTIECSSLAGASFKLADFAEASLRNVVESSGADFERASFKKSKIDHSNFVRSRFLQADMSEARILSSVFDHSQLVSATLDNSTLDMCRWRTCDVNGASFRGATLSSCEFSDTNTGDAVGLPIAGWTDGRLS
jgi:uncharacterized protein YjbI with pentapeptide repeats